MQQKNFVICDLEREYAKNFLHNVAERKEPGLSLHMFQDLEQLEAFAKQKDIHFLLFDGAIPMKQRKEIRARKRYVLLREEEGELDDSENGIEKYQSARQILNYVFCEPEREEKSPEPKKTLSTERLIGVYSPIHRIGKTKYAIDLGKELARQKPVLYLNLEGYAGESYFQEKLEQNLGELLYYVRQESENLGLRISMMAGQLGDMDYIEPIPILQDLQAVKAEEWMELLDRILEQCIYEVVILDLSEEVSGLFDILNRCEAVHTLYAEEPISKAKMKQYTENLIRTGYEAVLEHTVQKKVELRQ